MAKSVADIAWAAGLFEGEGCMTIGKRGYVQISLSMVDQDVVERFASVVGVGVIYDDKAPSKPSHWQRQFRWSCHSQNEAAAVVSAFLPFMGVRRRARAAEVLAALEAIKTRRTIPRRCRCCGEQFSDAASKRGRYRVFCSPACRSLWWDRSRWTNAMPRLDEVR